MIKSIVWTLIYFVLIVLAQVLVFSNIELNSYLVPYIYPLFILLLPFETSKWSLLLWAFLLGLVIDIMLNMIGVHIMATLLLAYLRPFVLQILAPRDGYESSTLPRLKTYGFAWFLKYAALLIILHHIVLFFLEAFGLGNFWPVLGRALLSSIFSIFFVVLSQFLVFRN